MRGTARRLLGAAAGAALFYAIANGAGAAGRDEDLAALRARIQALQAELSSREADRREVWEALKVSESAIAAANRTLRELEQQAGAARERLRRLGERRRGLEQSLASSEEALGRLLAARAALPLPDTIRLVLSGEDPNEVMRKRHYLSIVSQHAAAALEAHRAALAELDRLRTESAAESRQLQQIGERQRADRAQVLAQQRERQRLLARVSGELRGGKRQMRALLADERRMARLVQEIGRALTERPGAGFQRRDRAAEAPAPQGGFASLRGRLSPPVPGPLRPRPGATGGDRAGAARGLFLRAPQGDPVNAVAAGQVVFADWMRGFGNVLIVDHGEAYLSIYGSNETLLRKVGDRVAAGEAIAVVGASGGREESGVYFELRHLGQAFDPLRWLRIR